jgi:hypothetical protein
LDVLLLAVNVKANSELPALDHQIAQVAYPHAQWSDPAQPEQPIGPVVNGRLHLA